MPTRERTSRKVISACVVLVVLVACSISFRIGQLSTPTNTAHKSETSNRENGIQRSQGRGRSRGLHQRGQCAPVRALVRRARPHPPLVKAVLSRP